MLKIPFFLIFEWFRDLFRNQIRYAFEGAKVALFTSKWALRKDSLNRLNNPNLQKQGG